MLNSCCLHGRRCLRCGSPRTIPASLSRSPGWVWSRKVLSAPRGCQRLGRVGSANCRPGRRFFQYYPRPPGFSVGEVNLPADLHTQLAQASRELHAEPDTQRTMDRSVLLATELIPNCDHAGISIVHRNRTIDTPAATDEVARRGDELQYALDGGLAWTLSGTTTL